MKILARHPNVRLTAAFGSATMEAPRKLPALARIWDGEIVAYAADKIAPTAKAAFLALPEANAAETAPELLAKGIRVLDLSGAFRLRDDAFRLKFYPKTTTLPEGTVYGLAELDASALRTARLISCPGCYPTAALVAPGPLEAAGLLEGDVMIDAKSGLSGAGKAPTERTHFSENHGSVAAYASSRIATRRRSSRSWAAAGHVRAAPRSARPRHPRDDLRPGQAGHDGGEDRRDVRGRVSRRRLRPPDRRSTARDQAGRAHELLRPRLEAGRGVRTSDPGRCLDNLVKGAAGQAVQNFNLAFGLDERTGLL